MLDWHHENSTQSPCRWFASTHSNRRPKRYEYGITNKLYIAQEPSDPDTTTNLLNFKEAQTFDQASQGAIVEHLKCTRLLVLLAQDFVTRP
jgi:hypothetical protein